MDTAKWICVNKLLPMDSRLHYPWSISSIQLIRWIHPISNQNRKNTNQVNPYWFHTGFMRRFWCRLFADWLKRNHRITSSFFCCWVCENFMCCILLWYLFSQPRICQLTSKDKCGYISSQMDSSACKLDTVGSFKFIHLFLWENGLVMEDADKTTWSYFITILTNYIFSEMTFSGVHLPCHSARLHFFGWIPVFGQTILVVS